MQENQKIVIKKNSDSKNNFSSIKLCIQIKLRHKRNVKKKHHPRTIPGKKTPQKPEKKAKTREGEFFLKTNTRSTTITQLSHRNQKENKLPTKSLILELNQPAGFSANQPRKEGVEAKTWCCKMKQKSTTQKMLLRVKARPEEELG